MAHLVPPSLRFKANCSPHGCTHAGFAYPQGGGGGAGGDLEDPPTLPRNQNQKKKSSLEK